MSQWSLVNSYSNATHWNASENVSSQQGSVGKRSKAGSGKLFDWWLVGIGSKTYQRSRCRCLNGQKKPFMGYVETLCLIKGLVKVLLCANNDNKQSWELISFHTGNKTTSLCKLVKLLTPTKVLVIYQKILASGQKVDELDDRVLVWVSDLVLANRPSYVDVCVFVYVCLHKRVWMYMCLREGTWVYGAGCVCGCIKAHQNSPGTTPVMVHSPQGQQGRGPKEQDPSRAHLPRREPRSDSREADSPRQKVSNQGREGTASTRQWTPGTTSKSRPQPLHTPGGPVPQTERGFQHPQYPKRAASSPASPNAPATPLPETRPRRPWGTRRTSSPATGRAGPQA